MGLEREEDMKIIRYRRKAFVYGGDVLRFVDPALREQSDYAFGIEMRVKDIKQVLQICDIAVIIKFHFRLSPINMIS